ncbi:YfcC family protein [Clostridium transplantifaecale]|uniref:YfcC family protein n=1 Tax=Clostridium transplantifaecale TaxID=2479838 RepID=UPI000F638A2B|nr:TIGR00366 family protein [Clostridium transplantifaecale]
MKNTAKHSSSKGSFLERLLMKMPHTLVLVFFMIVAVTILTYIIPAGQYDREVINGVETVIPGSFHYVQQSPVSFFKIFTALDEGMINAASIIMFILVIGGSTGVLTETRAVDAMMAKVVLGKNGRKKEKLILIGITAFFAFLGGVVGLYEETLVFLPFAIMASIALGYDAVVGVSIGYLAMCVGSACAVMNPFTVAIAQEIAGLPLYSGMAYRGVVLVAMESVTMWYIFRYCKKIRQNPENSLVYGTDYSEMQLESDQSKIELNTRRKIVLFIFATMLIVLVVAVVRFGWGLVNMSGLFLIMAIASGLCMGMNGTQIANRFSKGVAEISFVALLVGIARGVTIVLNDGMIIDTIINALVSPMQVMPKSLAAICMYIIQMFMNFFIPSGSGQAMVAMPIMIPISDLLGVNRQIAVLAFQLGDGLSNMIIPMMGATAAAIQIGKIPFGKWLPFAGKLLAIQSVLSAVFLIIANLINYGPF